MKATVINQLPVDLSIAIDNVLSPGAERLLTFEAEFWADIQVAETKGWLTVREWWTDDGVRHEQALAAETVAVTGQQPEQTTPPEQSDQQPEQSDQQPEQSDQLPATAGDGNDAPDVTKQRGRRKAENH